MKLKLIPIIKTTAALLALAGVNTIFHPCSGMMAMKCERTTHIGSAVLAAIATVSLAELLINKKLINKLTGVISSLLSLTLFFIPLLGHCGGPRMHCNTHTMPAFRIAALLLFAVSLTGLVKELLTTSRRTTHEPV